ncbi:HupA family protein [Vibrio cholerae]|uniref:hypothetical protein n=1 Tax=Vibrio cholerae TaxID=666 RepID=UPI0004E2D816|nr:hypothetical protein [Vibrio cholerae]KFE21724.1 hypothetical protein DA89_3593 [Vibrio cholerae]BCK28007.1 hypothetical protein VCSRO77_1371 [Vibrio cholerae]
MKNKISTILGLVSILVGCSSGGQSNYNIPLEQPLIEGPVVESPVVESPVVESPVVESPVVESPVVESPVVDKADSEVFAVDKNNLESQMIGTIISRDTYIDSDFLNKNSFDGKNDLYTVSIDNDEVSFKDIAKDNEVITVKDIRKISSNNNIIGYYGYVLSYADKEILGNNDKYTRSDYIFAINAGEQRKPEYTATYKGTIFYDYDGSAGKEANLTMFYDNTKSMLTGTIEGNSQQGFNFFINNKMQEGNVYDDGSFIAELTLPNKNNVEGVMSGAFYGDKGQTAVGTVESINEKSWGGVFSAQVE